MKKYWVFKVIKMMVLGALALLVFGWVAMTLWNWLVPDLFHGPVINFMQAIGVIVLSKLLFGGFHGGRSCGGWKHRRGQWKEKMEAYMSYMTPEEKEKFREKMKERCGGRWGGFDKDEEKSKTN